MAKLTDKQKELLIADYHTNSFSQRELAKKYNISLGTVSNLTKQVSPKNEHLVNAQMSILSAQDELPNEQMNAIMNTAQDKLKHTKLIYNNATKLADKLNTMTDQVDEPQDLKHLVEANDKLAITLKVADRHAPKTEINNTNAQQNNNLTKAEISQAIAEALPD
jgi:transposase